MGAKEPKESPVCGKNCAHFIENVKYYHNRYLIWVFASIILIFIVFGIANNQYTSGINAIVDYQQQFCENLKHTNDTASVNKDSICFVGDRELLSLMEVNNSSLKSMLEMQYNKLQSEYTALTLWASALMIVFLIFSIYSMFKIDEMQKQGREVLNNLDTMKKNAKEISQAIEKNSEDEIKNIKDKSKEEIDKIAEQTNIKLRELTGSIEAERNKLEVLINEKAEDFNKQVEQYRQELESNSQSNNTLVNNLLNFLKEQSSSSKEGPES